MSQAHDRPTEARGDDRSSLSKDQFDELIDLIGTYYREELGEYLEAYPKETTLFPVSFQDLSRGFNDPELELAEAYLADPEEYQDDLDDAIDQVDLPVDRDLSGTTVQVVDLPAWYRYFPGEFSPKDEAGSYRAVTGEVSRATDVYAKLETAAFECQRCGTLRYIPQSDSTLQEPHECPGCERQGPFDVNLDNSELTDAQKLRIQTPPEVAQGSGHEIDVFVEGELADVATVGDRVTVTGVIHLQQQSSGNKKTPKYHPYIEGRHIELEESDHTDLDISSAEREEIRELATPDPDAPEDEQPLSMAGASLKPEVYGHETPKKMLVLAMVGRCDVDGLRGDFHVLLLGDPGTGKSELLSRVEEIAPRSVGVSGKGATEAGVTASAVQDDFGDGNAPTLKAGAFVKANDGTVCIDELDDMPADVRAAMLEPMSKQTIHISKWGINARLSARAAVVAAANPKHGRFDNYEPAHKQFDLEANLLSRFDLVFTFRDELDQERDTLIADRILTARDAKKRAAAGEPLDERDRESIEGPVDEDLLRKWIALAKRQPDPTFASDDVKQTLQEQYTELRGMYGYDEDEPVPVTHRKLLAVTRIAEAAAKFEFSETIEKRHARIATEAVGQSMRDFGMDEDGNYDADIQETGASKSQKERIQLVGNLVNDLQREYEDEEGAPKEAVIEAAIEEGLGDNQTRDILDKLYNRGEVYEPDHGYVKFVGWA